MSLSFAGNVGNRIQRATGLIANTGNFTSLFAVKIHSVKAQTVVFKLLASYSTTSTAHAIATASDGRSVMMYSNYLANTPTDVALTLNPNVWYWIAQRGNGNSVSVSVMLDGGSAWSTRSTTQTQFNPNRETYGSSDSSSDEAGRILVSHVWDWNAVLTDQELINQTKSRTLLRLANINTEATLAGASLATALTPQRGAAFTAPSGGVTVSTDEPAFQGSTPAPAPGPGPAPAPAPTPGSGIITINPGDIIEYHGDSTIWGHNSIDGNRVTTTAPMQFSTALGGVYDVRNEGVGSTSTSDLLAGDGVHAPWATYVNTSSAKVFIVNHGINDNYGGTTTPQQYKDNLITIVNLARGAGKQIILETPNPINSYPMGAYYDAMRAVATELNVPLIDQHQYLMTYLNGQPIQDICPDGTHPSQATYILKGNYAAGVFQSFLSEDPGTVEPTFFALINTTNSSAMYHNSDLTGQPVLNTNRVGSVLDTSGNGNHWRHAHDASARVEYLSANGGMVEIADNYWRSMVIDNTSRLVDVRKPWWFSMAMKLGGGINGYVVLLDRDYDANNELAAVIEAGNLLLEKKVGGSIVTATATGASAITTSTWGVISVGYDGTNLTARVNFGTKGITADTRSLPDAVGEAPLRQGQSPSAFHVKSLGFMDHYPNSAEESAAIAQIAALAGISIGTDPGNPPSPAPGPSPAPAPEPAPTDEWIERPFKASSPWNEKLSDAAAVVYTDASDPRTAAIRSTSFGAPGVNTVSWSINGGYAKSSDPSITIDVSPRHIGFDPEYQYKVTVKWPNGLVPGGTPPNSGTNRHMFIVDVDGVHMHEFFYLYNTTYTNAQGTQSTGWCAARHSYTRLDGNGWRMFNNATLEPIPGEADGGKEACLPVQASLIGGLIREGEVTGGEIPHAIAMGIPTQWVKGQVGSRVYPADETIVPDGKWVDTNSDGTLDTFQVFNGPIPFSTRFAIPPSVDVNALDIPADYKVLAKALQEYGAYIVTDSGNPCYWSENPGGLADGEALKTSGWATPMGIIQSHLVAVDWIPGAGSEGRPIVQVGGEINLAPYAKFLSTSVNSSNTIEFHGTYFSLSNNPTTALRVIRNNAIITDGTRVLNASGGNFSGTVAGLTPGDYILEFVITDATTGLTSVRSDSVSVNVIVTPPGYAEPPSAVQHWIVRSSDAPVQVPSDFVGMHFNSLPNGATPASDPSYGYGTVRSHDWDPAGNGGPLWLQGEPTQGARITTDIAAWMNYFSSKQRIWTWYGTPSWAASHLNTGGPYNIPGSNTMPTSQNAITGYIQHVLDTYQPQCIEIWNEPEPHPDYANGWFNGTPQQLATLTTWAVNAIGSRNVKVLAPAMTDFMADNPNTLKLTNWASNLSTNTKNNIDGFSWHWYDFDGNPNTTAARYHLVCQNVRTQVATHFGLSKPLYMTEIGSYTWSENDVIPLQDKANAVARWLLVSAAHGMKTCCLYAHEFIYAGKPAENSLVAQAIDNVNHYIAGRTIRQAAVLADGRVWIELSDGSTVIDGVSSTVSDDSRKRHLFFTMM